MPRAIENSDQTGRGSSRGVYRIERTSSVISIRRKAISTLLAIGKMPTLQTVLRYHRLCLLNRRVSVEQMHHKWQAPADLGRDRTQSS